MYILFRYFFSNIKVKKNTLSNTEKKIRENPKYLILILIESIIELISLC